MSEKGNKSAGKRKVKKRVSNKENEDDYESLQHAEINQNECAICLGIYEDDISNGILQKEWICCTNTSTCGLWMHAL